ncbi:hypothetical protein V8E36_009363 [Tilletia maclaganii]
MATSKVASSSSNKAKTKPPKSKKKAAPTSKRLSTSERVELVKHKVANPNLSQSELCRWVSEQFGKSIGQPAISAILSRKDELLSSTFKHSIVRFANKAGRIKDVDRHVYEWFLKFERKVAMSGQIVGVTATSGESGRSRKMCSWSKRELKQEETTAAMEEGNDQGEEEEEDEDEDEEIEVEDEVEVIDAPSVKLELSDTGEVIDQRAERDLAAAVDRLKIHSAMDLDFILNPPGENDEPIITEADEINGIIELLQQSSTEEEPEATLMEQPKVSLLKGLSAAKALRVWMDQQDDLSPEQSVRTRLALRAIERAIRTRQTKSAKQTSITQFFASSRAGPSSSSSRS